MRSSESITPAEIQIYADWCAANDVRCDDSPEAISNAELIGRYFKDTWNRDITPENLAQAFDALKPHLKFKTWQPYEKELGALFASLSPAEQESFAAWKGVRGLKSTAKAAFVLIDYVKQHGWVVDAQHLDLAAGQNRVQPFLEWDQSKLRQAPLKGKKVYAIIDDGKPTAFISGANKSPLDYRREMNEAAEKNNPTKSAPTSSVQAAAQAEAESLKGNTHSETEQLGRIFVTLPGTSEIDWIQTLASRRAFQRRLNNRQAVRQFIR